MILFMNARLLFAVLMTVLVLFMAACHSNEVSVAEPTEESMLPGIVGVETPVENPYENGQQESAATDATEPEQPSEAETTPEETVEEPTEPAMEPTEPSAEPTEGEEEVTEPTESGNSGITSYEAYLNMTGDQQRAFMESFDSIEAFFVWLNAAKAEYEAQNPGADIGDGSIDLGGGN